MFLLVICSHFSVVVWRLTIQATSSRDPKNHPLGLCLSCLSLDDKHRVAWFFADLFPFACVHSRVCIISMNSATVLVVGLSNCVLATFCPKIESDFAIEAFTYLCMASSIHLTSPSQTMVALACGAVLLMCALVEKTQHQLHHFC